MNLRMSGGMVRFGLPGLIFGVLISWIAGVHGPIAVAQSEGDEGSGKCREPGEDRRGR